MLFHVMQARILSYQIAKQSRQEKYRSINKIYFLILKVSPLHIVVLATLFFSIGVKPMSEDFLDVTFFVGFLRKRQKGEEAVTLIYETTRRSLRNCF